MYDIDYILLEMCNISGLMCFEFQNNDITFTLCLVVMMNTMLI